MEEGFIMSFLSVHLGMSTSKADKDQLNSVCSL